MKILWLLGCLLLAGQMSFSQVSPATSTPPPPEPEPAATGGNLMARKGAYTLEGTAGGNSLVDANYQLWTLIPGARLQHFSYGIKMRRFLNPRDPLIQKARNALRLQLSGNFYYGPAINPLYYNFNKNAASSVSALAAAGYEHHWFISRRLTPYAGFDLGFTYLRSKSQIEYKDTLVATPFTDFTGSSLGAGIQLIAGTDFYIDKYFYIGTEFGFILAVNRFRTEHSFRNIYTSAISVSNSATSITGNFVPNALFRIGFAFGGK